MMKKFIAVLAALSFSLFLHAACSTYASTPYSIPGPLSGPISSKISINEYNYFNNYIELKIIDPTILIDTNNLAGWKLSIISGTKHSDRKDYVVSDYNISCGASSQYIKIPTIGTLGNDSVVVLWSDAGMTQEVDYFRIGQGSYPTHTPSSCFAASEFPIASTSTWHQTILTGSASRKDIARGPDGTGKWIEAPYTGNDQGTVCGSNDATLSLTKVITSSTPYNVGEQVNFRITASLSIHAVQQTSVLLKDLLPTGLTYVAHTASSGTYTSSTGDWSIGTLSAGGTVTLDITAKIVQVGTLTNTANIQSIDFPAGSVAPATASLTVAQPLTLTKTVFPSTILYNSPADFIISVKNNSTASLPSSFTVNDTVPAGLTEGTPSVSDGNYTAGIWTLPANMLSGATYTLTLPVRSQTTSADFVNTAIAPIPFGGTDLSASATLTCSQVPQPASFNCVEVGADGSAGHIYTKLVNTLFNIDVVALKSDGISTETLYAVNSDKNVTVELVDGSGATACASRTAIDPAVTQTLIFTASDLGRKTAAMSVTKAYKDLRYRVTDATQFPSIITCSSDNFSIRPTGFSLSSATIKTGEEVNASTIGGGGYNGSANVTTSLTLPNANCNTTSNFLSDIEPKSLTFVADANKSTLIGKDIGTINVTISDITWTAVDRLNDCNTTITDGTVSNGKAGCDINSTLPFTISPYELNTTLKSFTTPSMTPTPWLYLDSSRAQHVEINATIQAFGKDGTLNKNFSDGCSASAVPLGFYFTPTGTIPSDLNVSLTSATGSTPTVPNLNSTYTSAFNGQFFTIPGTSFKNGDSNLSLKFNFIRSDSAPINPFDLNLTSIKTSSGYVDNNDTNLSHKATFVYGRVHTYDIKTDQPTTINPVELEVYGKNSTNAFLSNMPQNVLYWYRNINHDSNLSGSVLSGNTDVPALISINPYAYSPSDGLHSVQITYSGTSPITKTVHLDITPWLWYSSNPLKNYNYTTDCTQHPCFEYQFFGTAVSSGGVQSGTFKGADFNLTPAKTIIKKGVKVFR